MKSYYIIAGIAIIAFIALGVSSFIGSMTPYIEDFAKVRSSSKDKIQVPGDIVKDKTIYMHKSSSLIFYLRDPKGKELKVIYKGQRPANFDQADKAVAVGSYRNGVFYADDVRTKCPSKYQGVRGQGSGAGG